MLVCIKLIYKAFYQVNSANYTKKVVQTTNFKRIKKKNLHECKAKVSEAEISAFNRLLSYYLGFKK
jgi:hypothetical protein